ncbi:MAG: nuclear transport factor 2 family protein [Actinomycetota bacterium]|nr:nuclear transport factor 2 family protein [Actinomycetota bacterium]
MGDHPNAATFRQLIAAFNNQDMESAAGLIDADVVWHAIGMEEPMRGASALTESAMAFPQGLDVVAEIHDVVANDDHVVGLVKATATEGDQTFEYKTAEILHFKDGKVSERWAFSDDTARINEFFSQFG